MQQQSNALLDNIKQAAVYHFASNDADLGFKDMSPSPSLSSSGFNMSYGDAGRSGLST
jgi:hypothetical protein